MKEDSRLQKRPQSSTVLRISNLTSSLRTWAERTYLVRYHMAGVTTNMAFLGIALTGAVNRLSFPRVLQLARAALSPSTHMECRAALGAAKARSPLAVCRIMQSPSFQLESGISTLCTLVLISSFASSPFTPCSRKTGLIRTEDKQVEASLDCISSYMNGSDVCHWGHQAVHLTIKFQICVSLYDPLPALFHLLKEFWSLMQICNCSRSTTCQLLYILYKLAPWFYALS